MAKRHGGLTAMAVLNFVFGGIGAIAALLGFGAMSLIRQAMQVAQESGLKYEGQSITGAWIVLAATAFGALLLIISGVGYLKQSRFAGRTLGTLYGLVSLGGTVAGVMTGGGVGITTLLFAAYPLLTLLLVNTSFKRDLVN